MADNALTNPHPELRLDPAYIDARIRATYHYLGETPNDSDYAYWHTHVIENGDGWSGYWWDKMINGRPAVNPEPLPYPETAEQPASTPGFDVAAAFADLKAQSDANTAKIQAQINQVVKNFEKSTAPFVPALLALLQK